MPSNQHQDRNSKEVPVLESYVIEYLLLARSNRFQSILAQLPPDHIHSITQIGTPCLCVVAIGAKQLDLIPSEHFDRLSS